MLEIGKINSLTILRRTSVGLYLGDIENNEILLPNKYILSDKKIGDIIDVFIYKDSEERPIATTLSPFISLNEFALLEVKETNDHGAFLDWGLEKDLFVPFREQQNKMKTGRYYIVYMYLDKSTDRLTASSKIHKFLDNTNLDIAVEEMVDIIPYAETNLGFKVIVNHKYDGLVYRNEVFQDIEIGDPVKGFVKQIRDENKLDIRLQPSGLKNIESSSEFILLYLKGHQGYLNLTDKSDPKDIIEKLDMSKKTFKRAIGGLYKNRLIRMEQDGIYLVE